MKNIQENIVISEGRRSILEIIIAAFFYTIALALLFFLFYVLYQDFSLKSMEGCIGIFSLALSAFIPAIKFSMVNNIYFDFVNRKYKKEYAVGPVRIGKWIELPNIEYICVFRQGWSKDGDGDGISDASGQRYDVNVWHDTSKHFTIYTSNDIKPAYELAKHLAVKMEVDLLDASNPGDKKWVELTS